MESESDFIIRLRKPNWIIFLRHTLKLGIPVEMVHFFMKLFLKQRILALYRDFHLLLVAIKLLTEKIHSFHVKESVTGVGNFGKVRAGVALGHFTSDSATLVMSLYKPKAECMLQESVNALQQLERFKYLGVVVASDGW